MSSFRDLINVTFEDAVTYGTTDTSDILGVIMPYHWGPAGEVNIFNRQEFYEAYPEQKPAKVVLPTDADGAYIPYYQIKSFFNNGGSRVAVYRPAKTNEFYGETTGVHPTIGGVEVYFYGAFKYPGLPNGIDDPAISLTLPDGATEYVLALLDGATVIESFKGKLDDPTAVDSATGETTYLPKIVERSSQYLTITKTAPTAIPTTYTPSGADLPSLATVFATDAEIVPTMFLDYDAAVDAYYTSCSFVPAPAPAQGQTIPAGSGNKRFTINVWGQEKIQAFGTFHIIDCNAGVAGAYSNIARQTHLNQIASARAYGYYNGTLDSSHTFSQAQQAMDNGVVTVYSASNGPQIFGTRNDFNVGHSGSYFARCNVSRVLASILKNVISSCIDVIHTDTAANPISRKRFETDLNNIIGSYISTQDLQADSTAICNGSNNSDAQTQGGTILNIILALHFIGLVEKVNIRVVATDSSVTVNFS